MPRTSRRSSSSSRRRDRDDVSPTVDLASTSGSKSPRSCPWDDSLVSRQALDALRCPLCHVEADTVADMERHIGGQRHLAALTRWREDECKAAAEAGRDVRFVDASEEKYLPSIAERQREWNMRYTPGSKVPQHELTYMANPPVPKSARHDPQSYDYRQLANNMGQMSHRRGGGRDRDKDFYCDLCDVHVGSRGTMEAHLSGKEHKRKAKPERIYSCALCLVDVTSKETLEAHMKGVSHLRKAAEEDRRRRKHSSGDDADVGGDEGGASEREKKLLETLAQRDKQIKALQAQVQKLLAERREAILNGEMEVKSEVKEEPVW